jgi:phage major head subunit gpT-like protein
MGNMFNIGNQADLDAARVGFHSAFMSALETSEPDPCEILYREVQSTTALEEWQWLGDLPGFTEWKGDRVLSEIDAFNLQIRNRPWSNGLRLHQDQLKDDKLGLFAPAVQDLARVARQHRSDLMVQALLNGFAGSAFPEAGNGLAYDGAFFFSDSHQTGGGVTQSNKMSSALSASALSTARQKLRNMTTADGKRKLKLKGTHLIVGPKLEETAEKLLANDLVPNSAGTATESNIHKGKYKLIVSPLIDDDQDDYWFLADLSAVYRPMIFQLREDISTSAVVGNQGGSNDSVPRFQRGELWFGAEARYNVAYFAWQTIIGSAV